MTKGSFSTMTAEVIQKLDKRGLISTNSMNEQWEMQTLVKIRKRSFWDFFKFSDRKPKYTILALKLNEIVEEKIHLGSEKSLIVKDFKNSISDTFRVAVTENGGGQTDEESFSSLTLWSDSIRQEDLSVLIRGKGLKLVGGIEKKLNLKEGERLAFVTDRVYNTNSVEFKSNTSNPFFAFFDSKSDVSFTVPENTVFAFGLQEVTLDNGSLNIKPENKIVSETLHSANVHMAGEALMPGEALRPALPVHVIYIHPIVEIKGKEKNLKPLADVQEATRRSLMKSLTEILEDKEALTLLEDTLDECADDEYQPPQSKAVASFMDLLHKSKMSREMKEALHLLVSAFNGKYQYPF
ncbi:PREDICTED: uncharacterized protein LOC107095099 [Cyprinodon variegatus]|uniref:uncharacterized protein LOC107095099 n=1 Tax=Cyprinodon variegatus TaxID=28743 RepID=UPI0007425B0D|nr:PREDICTED: uncharacterized protein LOC107095099 [Cyprinodon variegatus]